MSLDFLQKLTNPQPAISEHDESVIRAVGEILGDETRARKIFEAIDEQITLDNYDQWLTLIEDLAREGGQKLSSRSTFSDVAFNVLDNDSFIDMIRGNNEVVKQRIVDALWAMYKQRVHEEKAKAAVAREAKRAQEEEEAVMNLVGSDDYPRTSLAPVVTMDVVPERPVIGKGIGDVDSILRQVISSPTELVSSAIKQVEAEGKEAWSQVQLPTNPHPAGSQAHKAWIKGLISAAKNSLGIVDKPSATKAKPKKKRK